MFALLVESSHMEKIETNRNSKLPSTTNPLPAIAQKAEGFNAVALVRHTSNDLKPIVFFPPPPSNSPDRMNPCRSLPVGRSLFLI